MHSRRTIREAVASILSTTPVAWKSVIESRIASSRVIWPYLMVFAESDSSDPQTVSDPCVYGRELSISIIGMLRLPGTGDKESVEDKMDEVSAEIETKLTQSALRDSVPQIQSLSLVSTVMEVIEDGEGNYHAEVTLSWRVGYSTLEGYPGSLL